MEWNKEIDRVYRDLVKIEEEIEILKKQGGDTSSDFDEFRRHVELIIEMCNDIKQSSHHEVRKVFSHSIESLENDLQFIRKNEIRINRQNEKSINHLGQLTQDKKKLATELRSLIKRVKDEDFENRELQANVQTLTNLYEEKMQDLTGHKHLAKLKEGLRDIFSEISENRVTEGLMVNTIFNYKKHEKG